MMKHATGIFACLTCLLLLSCNNSPYIDDLSEPRGIYGLGRVPDECLGLEEPELRLTILNQSSAPPANVSVFFRVTDNASNPIDGLQATNFSLFEQGRNDECFSQVSSSESFASISNNPQIFSNQTLLLLDLSNSVLENGLDQLKDASANFINALMPDSPNPSVQMAIYGFDGQDRLIEIQRLSANKGVLLAAIENISPAISQDPSTDLYGSVIRITEIASLMVQQARRNSYVAAASVVLFTDGTDQAARYTRQRALDVVDNADSDIAYYTIGLGDEIDEEVLQRIGKTFSAFASNSGELQETFESISQRLLSSANSYYLLEYCSPKRNGSGSNNLVIELNYDGKSGAVQTSFLADGFTTGCQVTE